MLFVGTENETTCKNTTVSLKKCKPFPNKPKLSTVLMSFRGLFQVWAATYRKDLRPILVLRDGSARRVFVDDRNVVTDEIGKIWRLSPVTKTVHNSRDFESNSGLDR